MNDRMNDKPRTERKKDPAFTVRHKFDIELDPDMALALADFIFANKPTNPAILAFAHTIQNEFPYDDDAAR